MARIKYKDPVTGEIKYADLAIQLPFPNGTANGDIPMWDNDNQEWVIKPKWKLFFQPVEYIENTSKQYIQSVYTPTNNTRIKAHFYTTAVMSSDNTPFGSKKTTGSPQYQYNLCVWSNVWYFDFGTNSGLSRNYDSSVNDYIIDINKNVVNFNGTDYTITDNVFTADYPIHIFTRNADNVSSPASANYCKMKLYSFEVWENNVKVRDMIPCYRIADGEIGMYDVVGNQFYTNAGAGTFTKGADV